MKAVFVARDASEAQLVIGLLVSRGIGATVRGDDPWGAHDDAGSPGASPTVFILDEARESEAQAVVATYQAAADLVQAGTAWHCQCGQDLEPQFSTCWSCGAERAQRA